MSNDQSHQCLGIDRSSSVIYIDDYGESHYIGPIEGAQPMSEGWVNGFDHQGKKKKKKIPL